MQKVNNSKDKPYCTQRNNRLKPYGACNVTSVIAALSAAGWPVKRLATDEDGQPEDALMRFILSDGETLALWRKLDPIGRHDANEWHPVLACGANKFLRVRGLLSGKKDAVEFGENWRIRDIEKIIMDGGAFVASGVFTAEGKKTIGHVVAIVGLRTDEDGSVTLMAVFTFTVAARGGSRPASGSVFFSSFTGVSPSSRSRGPVS